jgi:hypothetical protein
MIVLSHRGYWKDKSEKNKKIAFDRSFMLGIGAETDVRDCCGNIVISHDMPKGDEMNFEDVLRIMNGRNLPLAINIKADGLFDEISTLLGRYGHTNYFTFDMSIPEMVYQLCNKAHVFTGLNDIVRVPALLDESDGVWLDCFYSDWYGSDIVDGLLDMGKKVCLVSSDLHKRNYDEQWAKIKKYRDLASKNLMICTDHPEEAQRYFDD